MPNTIYSGLPFALSLTNIIKNLHEVKKYMTSPGGILELVACVHTRREQRRLVVYDGTSELSGTTVPRSSVRNLVLHN